MRRAVLPRVLSLAQVQRVVAKQSGCRSKCSVFGSLCVMGRRCLLSSYAASPQTPMALLFTGPAAVEWRRRHADLETAWAAC